MRHWLPLALGTVAALVILLVFIRGYPVESEELIGGVRFTGTSSRQRRESVINNRDHFASLFEFKSVICYVIGEAVTGGPCIACTATTTSGALIRFYCTSPGCQLDNASIMSSGGVTKQ